MSLFKGKTTTTTTPQTGTQTGSSTSLTGARRQGTSDTLNEILSGSRSKSLTGSLQQRLKDITTSSYTSGSSATTRRSGLDDPTVLNPVLDRLPGELATTLDNIRSNPYLARAQEISGDLVPEELTPLIATLIGEDTPRGYEAARGDITRDFLDTTRGIAHRGAALGPSGGGYAELQGDRAQDAFARNLTDAYDRSANDRVGLIADLVGQRTGATSNAINQLLGLDERITTGPTNALTAYSNILATLPLTRKDQSNTRSSSSTTSRTRGSELARTLSQTLGEQQGRQVGRTGTKTGEESMVGTRGTTYGRTTGTGGKSTTTSRPPLLSPGGIWDSLFG